jgi:hypothetical protein
MAAANTFSCFIHTGKIERSLPVNGSAKILKRAIGELLCINFPVHLHAPGISVNKMMKNDELNYAPVIRIGGIVLMNRIKETCEVI